MDDGILLGTWEAFGSMDFFTIRRMYTGGAFYGRFIWYESYDKVLVLVLGDTHFELCMRTKYACVFLISDSN
jgi:hypothetical protein